MDEPKTQSDASDPEVESRRRFFERLSITLGSICAAVVVIPSVVFLFLPVFRRVPQAWRDVGSSNKFEIGKTVLVSFEDTAPLPWAGVTARTAAWLRRDSTDQFTAFSINCTHLGCPVRWLQDANLFLCPCHGGVYYADGRVAAGPPPRPLFRYDTRIRNGAVEVLASALPIVGIK